MLKQLTWVPGTGFPSQAQITEGRCLLTGVYMEAWCLSQGSSVWLLTGGKLEVTRRYLEHPRAPGILRGLATMPVYRKMRQDFTLDLRANVKMWLTSRSNVIHRKTNCIHNFLKGTFLGPCYPLNDVHAPSDRLPACTKSSLGCISKHRTIRMLTGQWQRLYLNCFWTSRTQENCFK